MNSGPSSSIPENIKQKWKDSLSASKSVDGTLNAVAGIVGAAALGVATGGGATLVPTATGVALSLNLLNPVGLAASGVVAGIFAIKGVWDYCTASDT